MKISDLLDKYVNESDHERKLGRYWSSEIYSIKKGYLKPKDFFTKRHIDTTGQKRIVSGIGYEMLLNDILTKTGAKYDYNPKEVVKINDEIELVVKPDFVFADYLWELKTPSKRYFTIPEKWQYQLECETRVFKKKGYLVTLHYPFEIKFLPYKSSDIRWKNIQKILIDFHNKLKQLQK